MKWLLLMALIACGSKNPPMQDLMDADGDGIRNDEEILAGKDKMISDIEPFESISADIEFEQGNQTLVIEMTNRSDIKSYLLQLATKPTLKEIDDSKILGASLLARKGQALELTQDLFTLKISNLSPLKEKVFLSILGKDYELKNGASFKVNRLLLEKILAGTSVLQLTKENFPDLKKIIQKTYRVLVSNQTEEKFYYVSKELSFSQFLSAQGIERPASIPLEKLFYKDESRTTRSWLREEESIKIIVDSTEKNLRSAHLKNFNQKSEVLVRDNGKFVSDVKLVESMGSIGYVTMEALLLPRSFKEGIGFIKECRIRTYRDFIGAEVAADIDELLRSVKTVFKGKELVFDKNSKTLGIYKNSLIYPLEKQAQALEISLNNLPETTYKKSQYDTEECPGTFGQILYHQKPKLVNPEAKLTLKITTYIEKDTI
jgi:hypothetical protein